MSIVPEEGSIISNGANVNNEINGKLEESSSPTGKLKLENNQTSLLLYIDNLPMIYKRSYEYLCFYFYFIFIILP